MKKIVNNPENIVFEMMDGIVAANPGKFNKGGLSLTCLKGSMSRLPRWT